MILKQVGLDKILLMRSVGEIKSNFPDIPIELTCEEANNIIDSYEDTKMIEDLK